MEREYMSPRDCFPKFANGLNIKRDIAQKVYELWNCSFACFVAKKIFHGAKSVDKWVRIENFNKLQVGSTTPYLSVLTGFGLLCCSILGVDQKCHFQLYNSIGKKRCHNQKHLGHTCRVVNYLTQLLYTRHNNLLLIRNCSWILTIHKAKGHST